MIENIQSLSIRVCIYSVSSSEVNQEVVNTTIPVIKDVLDILTFHIEKLNSKILFI